MDGEVWLAGRGEGGSHTMVPGRLDRKKHVDKLIEGLTGELSKTYEKMVPSQTWSVYWIAHSLTLLEQPQFIDNVAEEIIEFMKECAHPEGGYGGGPGQIAHLATSFAAVNALITVSGEKALDSIDRARLVRFLHRMKQPDGSFKMHDDGEIDSRATYCALALLRSLNVQDQILLENVCEWILSCQTYEGGFASIPGSEAHGGYTFCCVASLCLMNQLHLADLPALIRWLTNKQLTSAGGFCGRSNKLVDSCYSYWQGAVFPLLHPFLRDLNLDATTKSSSSNYQQEEEQHKTSRNRPTTRRQTRADTEKSKVESSTSLAQLLDNWLLDCESLQEYILNQCQAKGGLLRDKPTAPPDFYHTCYALSGLSISQHQPDDSLFDIGSMPINILAPTHPLFNLTLGNLNYCFQYFENKKIQIFEQL